MVVFKKIILLLKVLSHCKLFSRTCIAVGIIIQDLKMLNPIFDYIKHCTLLFIYNLTLGCYGKLKPSKKTNCTTVVTESCCLSKFHIVINF